VISDKPKWEGHKVECAKCGDIIRSSYPGEFVTCKCTAISVDQTPYYSRYIGNFQDFIFEEAEEFQHSWNALMNKGE
jgi:hypothetical protein